MDHGSRRLITRGGRFRSPLFLGPEPIDVSSPDELTHDGSFGQAISVGQLPKHAAFVGIHANQEPLVFRCGRHVRHLYVGPIQ